MKSRRPVGNWEQDVDETLPEMTAGRRGLR